MRVKRDIATDYEHANKFCVY